MRNLLDRRRCAASLKGVDLGRVRRDCGVTQQTVADGLGVSRLTVAAFERRQNRPSEAYSRVVAGFLRHLAVTWSES